MQLVLLVSNSRIKALSHQLRTGEAELSSLSVQTICGGCHWSPYHLVRMCDSCAQSHGNSVAEHHVERVNEKSGAVKGTRDDEDGGRR